MVMATLKLPSWQSFSVWIKSIWKPLALILGTSILLAFLLAWISTGSIYSVLPFLVITLLSGLMLWGAWGLFGKEQLPGWLGYLLVGAVLLRLAAGVVWYVALPGWGHDSQAEKAGYIMADAAERDQEAWKLAQSDQPLWSAFRNNRSADQYGGMLFISALVYRYLGGQAHLPLQMVVISAAFSSLAVLFTWGLARRAWSAPTARLAAWGMALYPEVVLLGSSQMREAFLVPLTAAAFYGLLRYRQNNERAGLVWGVAAVLLCLAFSPPIAILLLALLAITTLAMAGSFKDLLRQRWFWPVAIALLLIVLAGVWLALKQFAPARMNNPLEMISWWLRKSADLQAYLSQHASGWMQKIFRSTPEWMHLPLLVTYGVLQPFLPAALVAGSHAPAWPWIVAWRSIGWTVLLVFLIYALILAFLEKSKDQNPFGPRFARLTSLTVWVVVLLASFRGGADMWDNPRYRASFAGLQIALAAWAWIEHRRQADPWLRRVLVGVALILAWFMPWYLRRYTGLEWPVVDLFKTLGLGFASTILFILWDWARVDPLPAERDTQPI
ncbi:MAG: glycosyltransferase family 39 protein [Anaerolineales bacterium]|nr:glycosyltransferase family 39 protein [Anaerolineales bacterium]